MLLFAVITHAPVLLLFSVTHLVLFMVSVTHLVLFIFSVTKLILVLFSITHLVLFMCAASLQLHTLSTVYF